MERQGQFRSKLWQTVALAILIVVICLISSYKAKRETVFVNGNDRGLRQQQGIMYYRGQPLTGSVYSRYPGGSKAKETSYVEGKENGRMESWYPNGQTEAVRVFNDGKKEGIHCGWWPNGKPKFAYQFKDDEYNGAVTEWYISGQLSKQFHYASGHEDGLEQMWWEDGSIRANYVMKDGQPYGLMGRKLCVNSDRNAR